MNSEHNALRVAAFHRYRSAGSKSRSNADSGRSKRGGWIARRYCEDDFVLCAWVYRLRRKHYEVALFAAEDHYRFVAGAGVMGGLVFILSDAYFKTGRMEVTFCGPASGGDPSLATGFEPEIPPSIAAFAERVGVPLPAGVRISNEEGQRLYLRITGLSKETESALKAKGADLLRTCFLVNRGIWLPEQVALIAREANQPARIFEGGATPLARLSYKAELLLLRVALLYERMKTILESSAEDVQVSGKWIAANVFEYRVNKQVSITTFAGGKCVIEPGKPFFVLFSARDSAGYECYLRSDIIVGLSSRTPGAVVVTKDFEWVGESAQKRLLSHLAAENVVLVQTVDTLGETDQFVALKLAQSASSRRPLEERKE